MKKLVLLLILSVQLGFSQVRVLDGYRFYFPTDRLALNSANAYGTVTDSGFVTLLNSITGTVTASQSVKGHRPVFTTTTTLGAKKRNCIRNFVNDGLLFNDHTMTKNKTGLTFYAVVNCPNPNTNTNRYGILLFLDANGDRSRFGLDVDWGSGTYVCKARRTDAEFSASSPLTYGKSVYQGDVVVCVRVDYSTGVLSIFTNGVLTSSLTGVSTGSTSNTDGLYDCLGNDLVLAPTTYFGFVGYYGDPCYYDVAHTDAQVKEQCKRYDDYYGLYQLQKPIFDYDTETKALVATYTTAPTTTQKDLINDLISGIKSDLGIPTLSVNFDYFLPFAAYNQQCAKLNWAKPQYSITENNSPTWTTAGYAGNGSNMYLDMGLVPNTSTLNGFTNNGEYGCYVRNNVASSGVAFGVSASGGATARTSLFPKFTDNKAYFLANNCSPTGTTVATSVGLNSCAWGILTTTGGTSQTSWIHYKNAVNFGQQSYACSSASNAKIFALARSNNNVADQYSTYQLSFIYYGRPIGLRANLYSRLLTYLTAYSAN